MAVQLKANNTNITPAVDFGNVLRYDCVISISEDKIIATATNISGNTIQSNAVNFIMIRYKYNEDTVTKFYAVGIDMNENGVLPILEYVHFPNSGLNIEIQILYTTDLNVISVSGRYHFGCSVPTITFIDGVEEDVDSTVGGYTILSSCFGNRVPHIHLIEKDASNNVIRDIILSLHKTSLDTYVYESVINKGFYSDSDYVAVRLDEDGNITESRLDEKQPAITVNESYYSNSPNLSNWQFNTISNFAQLKPGDTIKFVEDGDERLVSILNVSKNPTFTTTVRFTVCSYLDLNTYTYDLNTNKLNVEKVYLSTLNASVNELTRIVSI